MLGELPEGCHLLADRAYDSNRMRKLLADQSAIAVIPSMPRRNPILSYHAAIYKERNYVERFF
jgi:transposase